MGTEANNEDPDEMQHNAAFHQGLDFLPRLETKIHHNFENSTFDHLKLHNGQSPTYYINIYGKINQNTKGKCCISSGSALFSKIKRTFRDRNTS